MGFESRPFRFLTNVCYVARLLFPWCLLQPQKKREDSSSWKKNRIIYKKRVRALVNTIFTIKKWMQLSRGGRSKTWNNSDHRVPTGIHLGKGVNPSSNYTWMRKTWSAVKSAVRWSIVSDPTGSIAKTFDRPPLKPLTKLATTFGWIDEEGRTLPNPFSVKTDCTRGRIKDF